MQFSLKYSTVNNYRKILGKWIPRFWSEEELQNLTKADVHNLIFENMFSATPHQKKNLHKALRRVFEMAVEEGAINRNPARGIKVTIPAPKQKVLTSEEADKLLREGKLCNHRFYPLWALAEKWRDICS